MNENCSENFCVILSALNETEWQWLQKENKYIVRQDTSPFVKVIDKDMKRVVFVKLESEITLSCSLTLLTNTSQYVEYQLYRNGAVLQKVKAQNASEIPTKVKKIYIKKTEGRKF